MASFAPRMLRNATLAFSIRTVYYGKPRNHPKPSPTRQTHAINPEPHRLSELAARS